MSTTTVNLETRADYPQRPGFFARTESWLDERGKGAWIAAMVLGFMFSKSRHSVARHSGRYARHAMKSSGNSAFDAYKMETLRRLEEEQGNFEAFLERLREAKDKAEFDQFMDDRATKADDDA